MDFEFSSMRYELRKLADLATPLKAHQQRVVDRIQQPNQPGLVVAHGLGSGKTLTSIAAQEALGVPSTVIVPAALQANYAKERAKHLTGKSQSAAIRSMQSVARSKKDPIKADLMIVDEAHRAREGGTSTQQALRAADAEKRLLLTGSPFYNSPGDLSPLINIAAGESVLPNDRYDFERQFTSPKKVSPGLWGRLKGITPGEVPMLNQRRAGELKNLYGKWVDYHPNSAENFPEVDRETVQVPMSAEQLKTYDALIGKAPSWVAKKVRSGMPPSKQEAGDLNVFLNAARQAALSTRPFTTDKTKYEAPKVDAAYARLQKELESNPEARAVVYSNYLEGGIEPYRERLTAGGVPFGEYTGKIKRQDRDQLVRDYNEGKKRVLLMSSAGGEGLDLKGTRLIQMLEPHWNQEKLKQVEGRGIRFGSHAHLPEGDRRVRVEQYLATRPRAGLMEKMHLSAPGSSADEYLSQRSAEKERLIDQFRALLPQEKTSALSKVSLLERLVRLGATDVPGTPRLLMKHRTPQQLAGLQHAVAQGWDNRVTNPIMHVADKGLRKLPEGKLKSVVTNQVRNVARDPLGAVATNAVPIPGATLAYQAGKHGLEKLIDRVSPLATTSA